ncbi:odorant receptor 45b-like, partial [Zootermopsis nevadensis]|uniref:odorant receptor 45b-like n=1 Tax=Zootermopsis nevadensis TaxID=136037 RepID=UPI000B8ED72C
TSPIFFIYFIAATLVIVTHTFKLSLSVSLKYCCTLLFCLTQIFVYCHVGERVKTESLAVGDAAYSCHWYKRTNRFKRHILLILVRAQKPLYFSAGYEYIIYILHPPE